MAANCQKSLRIKIDKKSIFWSLLYIEESDKAKPVVSELFKIINYFISPDCLLSYAENQMVKRKKFNKAKFFQDLLKCSEYKELSKTYVYDNH